jgi:hypothetical protein
MDDTVYEVNKTLDVTPMMQLVDLNGTRVNFQSDFTVSVSDPSKQILVAVVNQDQLDEGKKLSFESTDHTGKYSRRVTYLDKNHLNHYIAIKKMDNEEIPISCTVVVKLKEIKPTPVENNMPNNMPSMSSMQGNMPNNMPSNMPSMQGNMPSMSSMPSNINDDTRKQLQQQLNSLKNTPQYNDISTNNENNIINTMKNMNNVNNTKYKMVMPEIEMTFFDRLRYDPYYTTFFVCLVLFVFILFLKFLKK